MTSRRTKLATFAAEAHDENTVFVCGASYEKRCLSIPLAFSPAAFKHVVVCQNENHVDHHRGHGDLIRKHFGGVATTAWLKTTDPIKTGDELFEKIGVVAEDSSLRIMVDVTTLTHESLLILLRILSIVRGFQRVQIVYNVAAEYSLGDPPESKWLSKGIGEIRSVLGYPGRTFPSRPLHLIVLVGLEHLRTIDLIGRYEPSRISLGYGRPSPSGPVASSAEHSFSSVSAIFQNAESFTFPVFETNAVCELIQSQVLQSPGHNVIVAAMNTKISTIGAALAAITNDEIQMSYAQAIVYNYLNYSSPSDEVVVCDSIGPRH